MKKTLKNIFLKLDFVLVLFSIFVSIFAFCGHNAKLIETSKNYAVFQNHNRNFLISNEPGKLFFYDSNKKIREIPISEKFNIKEYNTLITKYKPNCAIVAAATAGVGVAAFMSGSGAFLNTFGIAATEIESWFALAASGASVAEVTAAVKGTLVFWGIAGALVGTIVL